MQTIKISVTAEDIAAGERGKCARCPVALAVNRALPEFAAWVLAFEVPRNPAISAFAGSCVGQIGFCKRPAIPFRSAFHAQIPVTVAERINRFDTHNEMEPFEFEIQIPDRSA